MRVTAPTALGRGGSKRARGAVSRASGVVYDVQRFLNLFHGVLGY
jgi:hypothetical protein